MSKEMKKEVGAHLSAGKPFKEALSIAYSVKRRATDIPSNGPAPKQELLASIVRKVRAGKR